MAVNGTTSRRRFLTWVWLALGVAALAEAVWIVVSFLRPRPRRPAEDADETIFVAGPVAEFEPDTVTAFAGGKFYLVRLGEGGFLALHRSCTHLGCTVPWNEEERRFVCPCHASKFDITGDVLSAPAPRPLDLLEVRIENDVVKVVTGKPIRRATFEPSQVTRS
jgi:cytochrome b6-f complex iron-sulfur subunit